MNLLIQRLHGVHAAFIWDLSNSVHVTIPYPPDVMGYFLQVPICYSVFWCKVAQYLSIFVRHHYKRVVLVFQYLHIGNASLLGGTYSQECVCPCSVPVLPRGKSRRNF